MSLHPDALDRIVEADEPFAAVRTWGRAIAALIGFGLTAFMPWLIVADAMTRAAR